LFFNGCHKDESASLEVRVLNESGSPVSGASVRVYSFLDNLQNNSNVLYSATTNHNGIATISGIPVPTGGSSYYVHAQHGCQSSYLFGVPISKNWVYPGQKTAITKTIRNSGSLRFVNTSSNPYRVFLDGVVFIESMPGNTSRTFTYMAAKGYTVRVLQLSGFAVFPTDRTFTGTLSCGGTLTTTFP
jgi:hypothetical protein